MGYGAQLIMMNKRLDSARREKRPRASVYRQIRFSMLGLGAASGLVFPLLVGHFVLGEDHAASILYTVVCTVACIVVGIGNYWLFNRQVSGELHRIVEAMQRINRAVAKASETGNDLTGEHRLAITSNDDIGALEMSFNEMTDAIATRLNLEHRTRHLQQQLSRSVEVPRASKVILEEILSACDAIGGALYAKTENAAFHRLAVTGIDTGDSLPQLLSMNDGPISRAIETRALLDMSPVDDGLEWMRASTPFGTLQPRSVVAVPLEANDTTVGLVILATSSDRLTVEQRDIVESLRLQGGQQLQNTVLHDKVQKLAALDELTGLLNRRFGLRRLEEEFSISLRHGIPFSIMMMDIDHFKSFNDTFGHDAGDAVLKTFAAIVTRNLRAGDILCRYGGEEFLVGAPGTGIEDVATLGERLRRAVESERVHWQDQELRVTISVGAATWPIARASSPDELITDADQALYYAKNHGRNRVALHRGNEITTVNRAVVSKPHEDAGTERTGTREMKKRAA
jgi:diguanylate cyclase (GGDEF)-like protein